MLRHDLCGCFSTWAVSFCGFEEIYCYIERSIIMFGLIILQIVLIALNAIFACAEIAVLSINETKLERMADDGNKKAKRLFKLTREPAKFLATIQVAITLSGFLGCVSLRITSLSLW